MLSFEDVLAARDRIGDAVRHTPLDYSNTFSERTENEIHLKLELFQRTGAFKIRGATNRIATLSETDRNAGVVTASAGNHAQGVALAATRAGVDSKIVMPEHAPIAKVKATESYGGSVHLHGIDYSEAQERAHEIEREDGRTYLHAFDDWDVMAGQGTIGLEVMDDCPDADIVVVPIGGGGLISGVATAVKGIDPSVRVIGVQAEGASSVVDSIDEGEIVELDTVDTIADGIATRRIGEKPFNVIQERVDEVVTVSDPEIAMAITLLLERSKVVAEGAGAVALAAVLEQKFDYESGETIIPLLCGGNIDPNVLTTVLMRGLVQRGRYVKLRTVLKDRPGALTDLSRIIAENRANIYAIQHDRTARDIGMGSAEVELDIETRGNEHVEQLTESLEEQGYPVDILV
jgi:threonine dehydratase